MSDARLFLAEVLEAADAAQEFVNDRLLFTVYRSQFTVYHVKHQSTRTVPSNIVEGLTRKTSKDKLHFLNVSQASLSEIDTQIEIAIRLGYIDQQTYDTAEGSLVNVQKLLSGLSRSIH